jgi:hypothetical protein
MSEEISNPFGFPTLDKYNKGEEISFEEASFLHFIILISRYNKEKKMPLEERCTLFWNILDYYNKGKVHPKKIRYVKKCRKIIKEHHEIMKDDPERLTSAFLIKLTQCNCTKEK